MSASSVDALAAVEAWTEEGLWIEIVLCKGFRCWWFREEGRGDVDWLLRGVGCCFGGTLCRGQPNLSYLRRQQHCFVNFKLHKI